MILILLTADKQIIEIVIGVLLFILTVRLLVNYQPLFAASKRIRLFLAASLEYSEARPDYTGRQRSYTC